MKLNIFDLSKNKVGEVLLPQQFKEDYRPDLIQRSVLAIQSHKRRIYAASAEAGKRSSAKISRRRRDYRGSYGYGISRVPRKILSRRGSRMNWVGAFAPGTVGGRKAHPPKSEKFWWKKLNEKERKKAIRSAIAATMLIEIVKARGHLIPDSYPFALNDEFELLDKTKSINQIFKNLGLEKELLRIREKKLKAGKGKARGRKYKKRKGPLIVVASKDKLSKAVSNIHGVEVAEVRSLNTELLAPGAKPGRLTLWTISALNALEKEKLFI